MSKCIAMAISLANRLGAAIVFSSLLTVVIVMIEVYSLATHQLPRDWIPFLLPTVMAVVVGMAVWLQLRD